MTASSKDREKIWLFQFSNFFLSTDYLTPKPCKILWLTVILLDNYSACVRGQSETGEVVIHGVHSCLKVYSKSEELG